MSFSSSYTGAQMDTYLGYALDGAAKAWGNAPEALNSLNDSYNVSSITDAGTGACKFNLTNNFAALNFFHVVSSVAGSDNLGGVRADTTTSSLSAFWQAQSNSGAADDPAQGGNQMATGVLA